MFLFFCVACINSGASFIGVGYQFASFSACSLDKEFNYRHVVCNMLATFAMFISVCKEVSSFKKTWESNINYYY